MNSRRLITTKSSRLQHIHPANGEFNSNHQCSAAEELGAAASGLRTANNCRSVKNSARN
jgi:hypothetical protein